MKYVHITLTKMLWNTEPRDHIALCLSVCLSVCLSLSLSVSLSVSVSLSLSVSLWVGGCYSITHNYAPVEEMRRLKLGVM